MPIGNAASSESGVGIKPSAFAPSNGNWTRQALAPANSLTQQIPQQQDIRPQATQPDSGTAWKPNRAALEKVSRNLLDDRAAKLSSGFGLIAKTDASERKVDPFVSKLAAKPPENPAHLQNSLPCMSEDPAWPPIKLPGIDWTLYDKHRINGKTRISHDDWARVINLTKDFGGIIPTMVRTIQEGGDGGRGNVADVIGRVAEINPDHARIFQRELSTALGGETIPARMARMVGEPNDDSEAPGLLGPSKPAQHDFEQMRKDYWQNVETCKAEFERKQREILKAADIKPTRPEDYMNYIRQPEPPVTEEPKQIDPGRRGVVSTNPENPVYPDRGNFAEKLWGARVRAKPFVDEPRKGTYYFGGAGMDGAYIGDMVKSMQENGIGNSQAVDRTKWTSGEKVDAPMTLLRRNRDGVGTDFSQFGKDGKQFNMVGYSHGGLQAAQAAADYASAGGRVDHLVLVGTPISQEFLDSLQSNPNIGKVIVKNIEGQGDPIHAGMGAGELIMSLPKLTEDRKVGNEQGRSLGHFYYAGSDAEGMARRRELAKQLYDWGLR